MSFRDIYGQEKQLAILEQALIKDRVSHAYLFHGMDGVGKQTTAQMLAKALNCSGAKGDCCDVCPSCRKIERGIHPDIVTVASQGLFIRIQEIRELRRQANFAPFEGKKKVFIIAEAEKMNTPAANALLKTLEEPGLTNVLILLTARPYRVPATIRSRCQALRFNPLSTDRIAALLEKSFSLGKKEAQALASVSGGSIGKALSLQSNSYLDFKNRIIETFHLFKADCEQNFFMLFQVGDHFGNDKESAMEGLEILRSWYRDVLLYKETAAAALLVHQDMVEATEQAARRMSGDDIIRSIRIIQRTYQAVEQNAGRQLALESMALKLLLHASAHKVSMCCRG